MRLPRFARNDTGLRPSRFTRDDTLRHGGADRDRTGDLRRAKPALSHLSYSPKNFSAGKIFDSVHPISLFLMDSPVPAGRSTKF